MPKMWVKTNSGITNYNQKFCIWNTFLNSSCYQRNLRLSPSEILFKAQQIFKIRYSKNILNIIIFVQAHRWTFDNKYFIISSCRDQSFFERPARDFLSWRITKDHKQEFFRRNIFTMKNEHSQPLNLHLLHEQFLNDNPGTKAHFFGIFKKI